MTLPLFMNDERRVNHNVIALLFLYITNLLWNIIVKQYFSGCHCGADLILPKEFDQSYFKQFSLADVLFTAKVHQLISHYFVGFE